MSAAASPPDCPSTLSPSSPEVHILLFYDYVDIPYASLPSLQSSIHLLCTSLSLLGRIRLSPEGINGSVCGSAASTSAFTSSMASDPALSPYCSSIRYKRSTSTPPTPHPFTSLSIQLTDEVTSSGPMSTFAPSLHPTPHLSPAAFHDLLLHPHPDQLLIDVRNSYEVAIGCFPTALDPRIRSFAQLGLWVEQNVDRLRGRRVLMYCTGGVRCEKAAAFMQAQGVEDVQQLDGGIHEYLAEFGDQGLFEGKMTVFDRRGAVEGGQTVVGRCVACGEQWERHSEERRCRQCRCLVLTCEDCMEAGVPVLCEEHLLMVDGEEEQVERFLQRFGVEELERMREVVARCEEWVSDRRKGHPKRHRKRHQQLRLQRERLERALAMRQKAVDAEVSSLSTEADVEWDGTRRQEGDGVEDGVVREKERRAGADDAVFLPYMPLLNSRSSGSET